MQHMWLYSVCQCVLSVGVVVVSVRLCMMGSQSHTSGAMACNSVSRCLRICLGWTGAIGGAVEVPVSVVLNLRSSQCLYTCLTLVCCPLLVRQFTVCLLLLLALNSHLHCRLGHRHASLITRRRTFCMVLFSWVGSVLIAFAQFIFWNILDTWGGTQGDSTAGLGLDEEYNWTTPSPPPKYPGPQDRSLIGQYLPYGGFLSKFYLRDAQNFTYAEIHGSHSGVCAPDAVLRPEFLVYVYASTVFLLPVTVLMGIYLDVMCVAPKWLPIPEGSSKQQTNKVRSLALSLSLLVLLCLPLHTCHALLLFAPGTVQLSWTSPLASLLFQAYGLVPPLLYTPPIHCADASWPRPLSPCIPFVSQRKGMGAAVCSTVQSCPAPSHPGHSDGGKVCSKV